MSNKNRKCFACGVRYHFCPTCPDSEPEPSWKGMFDCEQCKEIFVALVERTSGRYTDQQVRDALAKYDMTDLSKYYTEISDALKAIYAEAPVVTEEVKPKDTPKRSKTTKKPKEED